MSLAFTCLSDTVVDISTETVAAEAVGKINASSILAQIWVHFTLIDIC